VKVPPSALPARVKMRPSPPSAPPARSRTAEILEGADASLLEVVDHVLNKGVSVTGDVVLAIAGVDLVYLRLSVLLCAADRLFAAPRR
jgi:gas vesicle protein GvpA/GvpJ/GvpM family